MSTFYSGRTYKFLKLMLVLDLDRWLSTAVHQLEGPVLLIGFDVLLVEFTTHKA